SSGLQITAVTKSGSNRFRGSGYDIQTNSDWDENSWVNAKNGDPKPKTSTKTLGYTIGGPVGKPGGSNKLFFFYSHEYRPVTAPTTDNLTQQPAVRVDYQLSSKLRFTGKYSGQRARRLITPGTIQGFNDVQNPYPYITNYGVTVDYTMNSSTFIEGTYGFIRNQLAGGGS